ncbi:MAG TPA: hypothetical protein VFJ76_04625 [Solirubrobacterales bacterium]|nr:hypothetical protein [Solirubrobacterales bacterium]
MAGKPLREPRFTKAVRALHEQIALAAPVAIAVYVLGLFHALGGGTDTGSPLFLLWALAGGIPIAVLFAYRVMKLRLRGRNLAGSTA